MTGLPPPNHTQVPNILLDVMMLDMSESELKVTLAIVRKTLGWHKKKDQISYSQLEKLTGMKRQAVSSGIDAALKRGLIEIVGTGSRGVNIFGLVINDQYENHTSESVDQYENHTRTSMKIKHTKETTQKKKESPSSDGDANSEPAKPKTERPRNPMYDAIKEVWGYTAARNGQMAALLNGTSTKKGYSEYNLDEPITPENLLKWAAWYRKTALGGDDKLNMVEELIKVQSSITRWQELTADGGADQKSEIDRMFETMDVIGGKPW